MSSLRTLPLTLAAGARGAIHHVSAGGADGQRQGRAGNLLRACAACHAPRGSNGSRGHAAAPEAPCDDGACCRCCAARSARLASGRLAAPDVRLFCSWVCHSICTPLDDPPYVHCRPILVVACQQSPGKSFTDWLDHACKIKLIDLYFVFIFIFIFIFIYIYISYILLCF